MKVGYENWAGHERLIGKSRALREVRNFKFF